MFMLLFPISGLLLFLSCSIIVLITTIKTRRTPLHYIWIFFNIAVGIWGISCFFMQKNFNINFVLFWIRIGHIGVIFIAIFFLHFVYILCNLKNKKLLIFAYLQGIIFSILIPTKKFISLQNIEIVFNSFYYDRAHGIIYPLFFSIWLILILYGHYKLLKTFFISYGSKRNQILYLFLGLLTGFSGGLTNFFPVFRINIFPIGNFTIIVYCIIVSYAILKYHLMDIRIIITRATIFIFVYSLVFAIPIILGLITKLWLISILLMGILSPIGIFVFSYLHQQIENVILKEQKRYQNALKELGKRMLQVRDLTLLLNTIVDDIYKVVSPEFIALYTLSKNTKSFIFYPKSISNNYSFPKEINHNSPLTDNLFKNKKPIFLESSFNINLPLETLIVPYFAYGNLYAFMFLGPKPKKSPYLESDLIAFDILSSQASLAIENCIFWQEERIRLAKEEQLKRQRTMDHFSASLAHEIDNPIFAIITFRENKNP